MPFDTVPLSQLMDSLSDHLGRGGAVWTTIFHLLKSVNYCAEDRECNYEFVIFIFQLANWRNRLNLHAVLSWTGIQNS